MNKFLAIFAALLVLALASVAEAQVYIGGGCYDCNPPGGQGPGIYTANGGRGSPGNGAGYNSGRSPGGGGRPVYSGNFGPNGYNGGGAGGGYGSAPNRGGNGGRRGGGGIQLLQTDDGAQSIRF